MLIEEIYEKLLRELGPQYWWPGDSTLEIMVGAVLTQSVAWNNVKKAIDKLKAAGNLTAEYIINAPEEELGEYIRSTLYYRQKSKKLKVLFNWLAEQGGDYEELFSRPLDELRQQMLALWGMGKETVDSILCYAGNLPIMVVDAYTRRIFSRLGLCDEKATYDELQAMLTAGLPKDVQVYNEMHALLVRVGNQFCGSKITRCPACPLHNDCRFALQGAGNRGMGVENL